MPARRSTTPFSRLFLTEHEPQIALLALTRLRWLAVIGQVAATIAAIRFLNLKLPVVPIAGVIKPPQQVTWLAVKFATDVEARRPLSLYVSHPRSGISCVNVFTNSAEGGN